MSFMFRKTRLCTSLMAACGGVLLSAGGVATAQQPPAQTLERVEITGSNIRRLEAETTSPVQTITQQEMVREGYTSITEVLRDITANNQGLLSQGLPGASHRGAAAYRLRGLGVGATLVLSTVCAWRRSRCPDDNQRNFVDISNIPFSGGRAVEVLLDGASAIYGARCDRRRA